DAFGPGQKLYGTSYWTQGSISRAAVVSPLDEAGEMLPRVQHDVLYGKRLALLLVQAPVIIQVSNLGAGVDFSGGVAIHPLHHRLAVLFPIAFVPVKILGKLGFRLANLVFGRVVQKVAALVV
nr:hypothetical protein [Tanacetum cinerariifolium]